MIHYLLYKVIGTYVLLLCFYIIMLPKYGCAVQDEIQIVKRVAKTLNSTEDLCQPHQVHVSLGSAATEMIVMWATKGPCDTVISYATHPWNLNSEYTGTHLELEPSLNNTYRFIHRVVLKELSLSTTYFFRPHVKNSFGAVLFYFTTPAPSNESWSSNFLVLGNVDSEKSTLESVINEAQSGRYSAVLCNGDLEEKLTPRDDQKGKDFLSEIEQAAGFVPFMTAPGKKVQGTEDGLYQYRHVFSMPGVEWPMPPSRLWYSFNVGLVHIVSYSTDVLFENDQKNTNAQQEWLVNDLQEANKRRSETPWIIAMGSHPMYCSFGVLDVDDCAKNTSKVRRLESMFFHFAVDLVIEARHNIYERTWPQYKGVVITKSYLEPRAPVAVIVGSGVGVKDVKGGTVDVNATVPVPAEWSAFHLETDSTMGNLSVVNSSHLQWELISLVDRSILDSFQIVQYNHGNFSLANLPHNISHQINQTIIAMGGKPGTYDFISGSAGSPSDGPGWSEYSLWLGLAVVGTVLIIIISMVAIRSCVKRKRVKAGRRWREVDRDGGAGGNFYSVASESDTDDNDFEIDVYDKANKQSSKLLTSY